MFYERIKIITKTYLIFLKIDCQILIRFKQDIFKQLGKIDLYILRKTISDKQFLSIF